MKRVLITGANSYIGMSFEAYAKEYCVGDFEIDTVDMQNPNWRKMDFSKYNTVFHVAGIAHQREKKSNEHLYYEINRDLAVETAKKAKKEGVKHFVFLSTMSVYGMTTGEIDCNTLPNPVTAYGNSKLEAEKHILDLEDEDFVVSVLRPPMVYGKGCKGNYQLLRKFAMKINFFPDYQNRRSMIYIDNLSSTIVQLMRNQVSGIFFPQNVNYMSTLNIVKSIGVYNQRKIHLIKVFNPFIDLFSLYVNVFKKVFGSLTYSQDMNVPISWLRQIDNEETIRSTEYNGEYFEFSQNDKSVLVLMSTYNGEKYLEAQILSILDQDFDGKIDIRIRDDGSTDKTVEVIEKLQQQYADRIELIKGSNKGYNASFFELIDSASGYDYYAISDQDDIWLKEKIRVACGYMSREDDSTPLLYASTSYLVHDDLKPYGTTRKKIREFSLYNTIIQNICPGHTQVMNNALIKLIQDNVEVEKVYVYDSWIMNVAMLLGKIIFDNNSYTYYRQHITNQLGSGQGTIGQLLASKKRIDNAHGKKYRNQALYFVQMYKEILKEKGYLEILERYARCKTFVDRVKCVFGGKLYRQKKIETIAFYIALILGKY